MSTFTQKVLPAILISGGLTVGGWFVGQGLESFRQAERFITIKGLAEQDVKSDFAIWGLSFRRAGEDYQQVRSELTTDREAVVAFLQEQGFTADEIEARPLRITDLMAREYGQQEVALRYTGEGSVLVRSSRVDLVAKVSNAIDPLITAGVPLSQEGPGGGPPRYFLRGFNDVKPELLEQAVNNAREQAEKFAADAGADLGQLRRANQGTIQILDDDGSDGYSSGLTSGKRVRVVSTFEYLLQ
ncbi:MAG TPA: SIMPL domain-containing protein [Orrella sp.]